MGVGLLCGQGVNYFLDTVVDHHLCVGVALRGVLEQVVPQFLVPPVGVRHQILNLHVGPFAVFELQQ